MAGWRDALPDLQIHYEWLGFETFYPQHHPLVLLYPQHQSTTSSDASLPHQQSQQLISSGSSPAGNIGHAMSGPAAGSSKGGGAAVAGTTAEESSTSDWPRSAAALAAAAAIGAGPGDGRILFRWVIEVGH